MASLLLLLITTLAVVLPLPASTTSDSITISLSLHLHDPNPPPYHDPYHHLSNLVTSSLKRAHHLKNPEAKTTVTQISPESYGGYTVHLSFGTPPQTLPFMMDTGSDLVWFPCTKRYRCHDCSYYFSPANKQVKTFIPELSSTARPLGCPHRKCSWLNHNSSNCAIGVAGSKICPPYQLVYGDGNTTGNLLTETLVLPTLSVPNFVAGCSVEATHQPNVGLVGMGHGPMSLPRQLGLKKFSFCLLSRTFDDTNKSTSLILDFGENDSSRKTAGMSYTPFLKNPVVPGNAAYQAHYYVGLRKITVGGRRVKIPHKYLKSANGRGGTIIDSGMTFTVMVRGVLQRVAKEVARQGKRNLGLRRVREAEKVLGLWPCFDVSEMNKTKALPEMRFYFKGGAEMVYPQENLYFDLKKVPVMCMTVKSADFFQDAGPSIVLGSFHMQNFYLEYDLRNERLGFRQQKCD